MSIPFSSARPLWLLGCGNMAGAMLGRWLESGLDPAAVTIIDPNRTSAPEGVRLVAAAPEGETPMALLLGVKPQMFAAATEQAGRLAGPSTTIFSIMAGVDGATLAARFPEAAAIVRLMPNLPVALGKGVAILHAARTNGETRGLGDALATPLGLTLWVDDEKLVDAGTAVSGSGPAFVYRFIDAMAAGARALGFPPAEAAALALATVEGASALAAAADVDPAALAERVASPGGTTRAGLDILDRGDALVGLVGDTLDAAAKRAVELAREAQPSR